MISEYFVVLVAGACESVKSLTCAIILVRYYIGFCIGIEWSYGDDYVCNCVLHG